MSTPKVGDRVVCRFDQDTTYFWAEGDVVSINKHDRARIRWDDPRMDTGLIPVSELVKVTRLEDLLVVRRGVR